MNYEYKLRIVGPSPEEIRQDDPGLWDEIESDRDDRDSDDDAVLRFLGGVTGRMEEAATAKLDSLMFNVGWSVKIEGGTTHGLLRLA